MFCINHLGNNLIIKCPLCEASYIKACETKHNRTKKHIFNIKAYEEAQDFILKNGIFCKLYLKIYNIKIRCSTPYPK